MAYPKSVVPPVTQPVLIWAVLLIVLGLEFACAALTGFGAWSMWKKRDASSKEFAAAKKHALNGLGVAVVIWLLLFGTLGAAVFQMWQTQIGTGSFNGAFQFTVYGLLLFGLISIGEAA